MRNSLVVVTYAGLAISCGTAAADVLYDSLAPIADPDRRPYASGGLFATWDVLDSFIGGGDALGDSFDLQSADDFDLSDRRMITGVTFDMASGFFGPNLPSNVLIEFFADNGGSPSEVATASVTTSDLSAELFNQDSGLGGNVGQRVSIDLSSNEIVLDAGTWWVSFVAISEDDTFVLFRDYTRSTGGAAQYRDGGIDHGNGLPGFFGVNDWVSWGSLGIGFPEQGDIAMRIEGVVPSPGVAGMVGALCAFGGLRRRRI